MLDVKAAPRPRSGRSGSGLSLTPPRAVLRRLVEPYGDVGLRKFGSRNPASDGSRIVDTFGASFCTAS